MQSPSLAFVLLNGQQCQHYFLQMNHWVEFFNCIIKFFGSVQIKLGKKENEY
jgi:hypothetical protein